MPPLSLLALALACISSASEVLDGAESAGGSADHFTAKKHHGRLMRRVKRNKVQAVVDKDQQLETSMDLTVSATLSEHFHSNDQLIDLDRLREEWRQLRSIGEHALVQSVQNRPSTFQDLKQETIDRERQAGNQSTGNQNERRVIAMSVYGNGTAYLEGAVKNAELAAKIYPGWKIRFYVSTEVPKTIVARLKEHNAEIFRVKDAEGSTGMFWRFMVADDPSVDRFIIRDTDSRLSAREKAAVDEWIASGKALHCMRDHQWHAMPVMGGMWGAVHGFANKVNFSMTTSIMEFGEWKQYNDDQRFLAAVVRDPAYSRLEHDAFNCEKFPGAVGFPTRRTDKHFVGEQFDEHDVTRIGLLDKLAPMACRRDESWWLG